MIRLLTVSMMLLMILGCNQSEKVETTEKSKETVTEKMDEAAKNAAVYVNDVAETVTEKAGDLKTKAESAVRETVEETGEIAAVAADKTQEMADQAAVATKEVMTDTKEAISGAVDVAAEKSKAAAVAVTTAAEEGVEKTLQAISPETIMLEASYGQVTFPHALHGDAYACSHCHGEGMPGLFGLDKEKAHVLCKDCHKQEGSGPTACKGCHKK